MKPWIPTLASIVLLLAACSANPPPGPPEPDAATPENLEGIPNFARISRGVWRGAQPTAEGMAKLKEMGVKTIVNLRALHTDRDELRGLGLDYAHFPCTAVVPDEEVVVKFLKIATDPERRPVFVHCQHGSDRTGVLIAAYRIVVQGWSREKAKRELPVFGFHDVFLPLERYLDEFDADAVRKKMETAKCEVVNIP
jgi:tyrosine-protein phosphatase SIW14